jgi:hypothetical protein
MTTGLAFPNFSLKRLLSLEDFDDRFFQFLLNELRTYASQVYDDDGTFDTIMTVSGTSADTVTILQASPSTFQGTDGIGNIIDLGISGSEVEGYGQVKEVKLENTSAITYYLSLLYTERPSGIQINPRTAYPEYEENIQIVGKKANPNLVIDNTGTITFNIDSSCESGQSYAGRKALVYMNTPGKNATTEAIALEICTVTWNTVNNRITTVDVLGQESVSTNVADYNVILLGPHVSTSDTVSTSGHMYIASVLGTGAGSIPSDGDTTGQNVIDSSLSSLMSYDGGPDWPDGTTNPATSINLQLDKIITDLSSTTTDYSGAAKLNIDARPNWIDGITNPATRLDTAIDKIITDLASTTTDYSGAAKIRVDARSNWKDAEPNPQARVDEALEKIIIDLIDTTLDHSGATRIGIHSRADWADSGPTHNIQPNIYGAINEIITDLTSTSGERGSGKITSPEISNVETDEVDVDHTVLAADTISNQLIEVANKIAVPSQLRAAAAKNYSKPTRSMALNPIRDFDVINSYTLATVSRYITICDDGDGPELGTGGAFSYFENFDTDRVDGATFTNPGDVTEAKGIAYDTSFGTTGKIFVCLTSDNPDTKLVIQYINGFVGGTGAPGSTWVQNSSAFTGVSAMSAFYSNLFSTCYVTGRRYSGSTGAQIFFASDCTVAFAPVGGTFPENIGSRIYCLAEATCLLHLYV